MGSDALDIPAMRDLVSAPGVDTRQWFTHGIVLADTSDQHSVRFNDDQGTPLPHGVLIDVKLQPSGIILPCRVSSMTAGSGEGEYTPFGPGDEVFVAIPDGDEKNGGIIVGRGSNSLDTFPATVAGQDVTQNNVSFKRVKVPYIFETGASYLVRSALTGASWSMDPTGNVMFSDGSGNHLALTNTVIQLAESTGAALVQIDPSKLQVALQANATSLVLDGDASTFLTSGTFSIGTSGVNATGHAVTIEQVIVMIQQFFVAMGQIMPSMWMGSIVGNPGTVAAASAVAIATAASFPLDPASLGALQVALIVPPDPTGTIPGVGKAGLMF